MLPNYDARAVAEVMGIGFQRLPDHAPKRSGVPGDMFSLLVNGLNVRVVDAGKSIGEARDFHSASSALIERIVEKGLPRNALRHVAEHLAGADKARIATVEWGVVPKTTLERRQVQLSPQESERTERVARLFVHARRALGSEDEARHFMLAPHPELDGRTPVDAARTDLGTRRTEQLLNALEYGLAL